MIAVKNLCKHFGKVKAVDDISFDVKEGENLILLGTSGCGKTTTLKMINRLIEPTKGDISVNGKSIYQQSPELLRRGIGYVLQNNGLFPHYTVAQNMAIVPQLLGWDKKRINNRADELIEKIHLQKEQLNAYPDQLSGGQQQRVGLARALMADPPVLLMDEPFGALDPVTRFKIRREFKELDELKRKTIIMVTHDVQEAFELGDRICLMDKGRIVQTGTPAELLFKPANNFVKEFLAKQRLQLEFKAVTLFDVWDSLPDDLAETHTAINKNLTVWEVLETLTANAKQPLTAANPANGQTKTLTFNGLMAAFYQYETAEA
ncbi:osmoprotectant transport system ATP-binding protein [Mucilaginibacter gracilis]|uniref:Osmoprotectant transport system ATP-binding protein n=1 Tax=Mucilaginibacter gracilis TaxID=423350 RepID=A0A495IV24_9SPHI|nr:ABC transporter ATP-binding protein [Mucilaginibacter gracilis]RKR80161.1 osmoprotectant transport system ATP-binding protein [Mucilaginibacter gracilis]